MDRERRAHEDAALRRREERLRREAVRDQEKYEKRVAQRSGCGMVIIVVYLLLLAVFLIGWIVTAIAQL